LIHGAPVGKPAANKATVTAVYEDTDGSETHFSRVILGSASDYRINGKVCKSVFVKPNFLVCLVS